MVTSTRATVVNEASGHIHSVADSMSISEFSLITLGWIEEHSNVASAASGVRLSAGWLLKCAATSTLSDNDETLPHFARVTARFSEVDS